MILFITCYHIVHFAARPPRFVDSGGEKSLLLCLYMRVCSAMIMTAVTSCFCFNIVMQQLLSNCVFEFYTSPSVNRRTSTVYETEAQWKYLARSEQLEELKPGSKGKNYAMVQGNFYGNVL